MLKAFPSPHQGNPDQQTPAAVVRQSWPDAAPAPSRLAIASSEEIEVIPTEKAAQVSK